MSRVVVVGGGPGGTEVAFRCARSGHSVTIVERDRFGGTCTNRGCIPTKFLLAAVGRELQKSGRVDPESWTRIQARKKALTDGLARKIGEDLRAAGVTVVEGEGALEGPGEVGVAGPGGTRTVLRAETIVLATGAEPAGLPGFPPDGRRVLSSDDLLELQEIPASLVIIGSGFIGCEFGRLFSLLGTRVTMLEALPHLMPAEDEDTSLAVSREFERRGVAVMAGVRVASLAAGEEGVTVKLGDGRVIEASRALLSVGRVPAASSLGLEKVGLAPGRGREVAVNDLMETGAEGVYAVGDVTGRIMLAHVATAQGITAAGRIRGENRPQDYRAVPYAVFVTPEVATVGHTERSARAAGLEYRVGKASWSDNIKARIDQEQTGFVKVIANGANGTLLGGTIVGARAAELVHVLAVAVQAGLTARDFARGIFAHPTLSESFRAAAESLDSNLHAKAPEDAP